MPKAWMSVLLLLGMLSACGVVGEAVSAAADGVAVGGRAAAERAAAEATAGAGPSASPRAEATTEPVEDESLAPRTLLRRAVRNLRSSPVDFEFTMTVLDVDSQVTRGTYYRKPQRWAVTSAVTEWERGGDRTEAVVRATSVGGEFFVSSETWRGVDEGCWLAVEGPVSPYGLVRPGAVPVYVGVLDELRPSRWTKAMTTGTTTARLPLDQALALLPEWSIDVMKLKRPHPQDRYVEVLLEIVDSRLVALSVPRSSLDEPLREAGKLSDRAAATLRATTLEVRYPLDGDPLPAQRPGDELVMSYEDTQAGRGCRGGDSV